MSDDNTTGPSPEEDGSQPLHILVVEDDPDIADVLTLLITRLGHQVRVATTAKRGLAAAADEQPDLILCDLGLPGMSGFQFAEAVRADAQLQSLRLVALTGYGGPSVRDKALAVGFEEHVVKPVTMAQLAELFERFERSH